MSHGRAQMVDHALHVPTVEAAPRYVQLLYAAQRGRGEGTGTGETGGPEELRLTEQTEADREHESNMWARAAAENPEQPPRLSSSRRLFSDKDLDTQDIRTWTPLPPNNTVGVYPEFPPALERQVTYVIAVSDSCRPSTLRYSRSLQLPRMLSRAGVGMVELDRSI